jgi:hypothetical protein
VSFPALTPKFYRGGQAYSPGPLTLSGWDRATLGGFVMPGKSKVTGGSMKVKEDRKSTAGSDGARPTLHGIDPQRFELEVYVWTDEQAEELLRICREILPLSGVNRAPLALVHPDILHMGDAVMMNVLGCGVMEREGTARRIKFHLLHWLAPKRGSKPATNTPIKGVRNARREAAEKQNPPNPTPTQQAGVAGPPAGLTKR